MRLRFISVVVLPILFTGCVTTSTANETANADYGYEISQPECESHVREYFKRTLKDFESARITYGGCYKGWIAGDTFRSVPVAYGYVIEGSVNAKNSFGGYTGRTPFAAVIKNNTLRRFDLARTGRRSMSTTFWNSKGQIYRWD